MSNEIEKIKKPSAFVSQSSHKMTISQKKIYNLFLHIANSEIKKEPSKTDFKIKISDLRKETGIGTTDYQRIKEEISALAKTNVFYNILNKSKNDYSNWVTFNLLAYAIKVDEQIEFGFPKPVLEFIKNPDMFALLDKLILKDLKKKYSIILYELFEDYKNLSIPTMSIEQLRNLFGIEKNKYPNFYDLEKWAIIPAIKEINEKIGIMMEYKKLPEGAGKTTHIKFIFYTGPDLARKIYEESQKK